MDSPVRAKASTRAELVAWGPRRAARERRISAARERRESSVQEEGRIHKGDNFLVFGLLMNFMIMNLVSKT